MTRHRSRPVDVVLRHGRGCPRAALARARASSVEPEPEVWRSHGVRSGFGVPDRKSGAKPSAINALDHDLRSETAARKSGARASDPVAKIDMGQPPRISRQLPGPLIAEVCAGLDHIRGRFPKVLWLGGSL